MYEASCACLLAAAPERGWEVCRVGRVGGRGWREGGRERGRGRERAGEGGRGREGDLPCSSLCPFVPLTFTTPTHTRAHARAPGHRRAGRPRQDGQHERPQRPARGVFPARCFRQHCRPPAGRRGPQADGRVKRRQGQERRRCGPRGGGTNRQNERGRCGASSSSVPRRPRVPCAVRPRHMWQPPSFLLATHGAPLQPGQLQLQCHFALRQHICTPAASTVSRATDIVVLVAAHRRPRHFCLRTHAHRRRVVPRASRHRCHQGYQHRHCQQRRGHQKGGGQHRQEAGCRVSES